MQGSVARAAGHAKLPYEEPDDVKVIEGFRSADPEEIIKEYGLAMDAADVRFCQEYFQSEDRDPTMTELRMIDTYWSDHCRHTTFLTELHSIEVEDEYVKATLQDYLERRSQLYADSPKKRPVSLMDLGTIAAKILKKSGVLDNLDESDEVNACSIKIKVDVDGQEQDWLLMFKNETHNHPTEIEPFGGAATCLGGAIRDPLAGRAYVYQAMRVTGAGDPRTPVSQTLPGKLPQSKLTVAAANGYSAYGNQIGVATGLVSEIYHPRYVAKRMEVGRGGRRRTRRECGQEKSRSPAMSLSCSAAAPAATATAARPAARKRIPPSRLRAAAPKMQKGQPARRTQAAETVSQPRSVPPYHTLQRFRRGRRFGGDRRACGRAFNRAGPRAQKI